MSYSQPAMIPMPQQYYQPISLSQTSLNQSSFQSQPAQYLPNHAYQNQKFAQIPVIQNPAPNYRPVTVYQPQVYQQPQPIYNIHYRGRTPPVKPKVIESNYEIVRGKKK